MNILIINGSARKNGFCNTIAYSLKEELQSSNAEINTSIFTIAEKNIGFCAGCEKCCADVNRYCIINDDAHEAYKLMESADSIVYISPIYESFISGILKNFIDRANHYTSFFKLAGKPLNLILCGVQPLKGETKEFSNEHVIKNISEYLENYSMIIHTQPIFLGFVQHQDHHSSENNDNGEFKDQISEMAKVLVKQKIDNTLIENAQKPYIV
jgi:multimeric flavodoxin WrbA